MRITKETPIGEDFNGKPKKMSWERIWTFSGGAFTAEGWPRKNLHTDTDFAQNLGLPTVGVSATQYLGHLAELMLDLFGEEWLRSGKMIDVKFIKLVSDGDTLTSRARVIEKVEEFSGTRYSLEICCENQRGEKVLIGSAIGISPL